ncbi:unnamed protein product [Boreogadus saida]
MSDITFFMNLWSVETIEEAQTEGGVLKAVVMATGRPTLSKAMKEASDVWIGSYFLQTRWRWIDGTGMYYQEFISPSSSTSSACTCLRTSGWAKASCSTNMRFICSTSPGSC